ncbi:hypothetical protein RF11_09979 [Thelohanellus kitauei]|uniref:Uncharacterized protein n=1 Tax=Thelohanellus kitauei TaxID=669202 RepID=A0A0C2MTV3_THEKT|nr:hypothetical protein RF11_09979 [Thelohanellus kitauei]
MIEIFLCLIAIARIPHSDNSDVLPDSVKSVDLTFPLLQDFQITVSGKWALKVVTTRDPFHFTNADFFSVAYELEIDSMRICLHKEENELCINYYFDHSLSYSIERKERSYSIKEESISASGRQGQFVRLEVKDLSIKVAKNNERPFNLKI